MVSNNGPIFPHCNKYYKIAGNNPTKMCVKKKKAQCLHMQTCNLLQVTKGGLQLYFKRLNNYKRMECIRKIWINFLAEKK